MKSKIVIAAGAAALLLLGACEKKAGGQVVAVVNGQEITQQELNAELGNAQVPAGESKQVMAQLLQRVIDRRLAVGRATADGLDQLPLYLAQLRRAQDQILVSMLAQKLAKGQPVPDAAATERYIAGNPGLFAGRRRYLLDQIAFPATNAAPLLAKLSAARTMAEIEAVLTSGGVRFTKGSSTLDSAAIPNDLNQRIAALPAGEPFIVPQGGQYFANVIRATENAATPAAQSRPLATDLLRRQGLEQAMAKVVTDERAKAKIEYQPGFEPPAAGAKRAATAS